MTVYYEHPTNGYREVGTTSFTWLWCLLFGFFFHLYKFDWKGALVNVVAALCSGGISWLVMPFFAHAFVTNAYRSRGWRQVSDGIERRPAERPQEAGPGLNPTWPTPQPAAPPAGTVGASVADPVGDGRERGSNIVLAGLAVLVLVGLTAAVLGNRENTPRTAVPTGFTTVVETPKAIAEPAPVKPKSAKLKKQTKPNRD